MARLGHRGIHSLCKAGRPVKTDGVSIGQTDYMTLGGVMPARKEVSPGPENQYGDG